MSSIPIIKNVFHLTYVENRGAAFGMLQNNQSIFIIVALAASVFGLYYLHTKKVNILGKTGITLIIAGAIGNLIDRVRLGFVVDYFDFRFIWEYVFNVADVFVVVGTIVLCIYIIFFEEEKQVK
jgi:signal peptidase II